MRDASLVLGFQEDLSDWYRASWMKREMGCEKVVLDQGRPWGPAAWPGKGSGENTWSVPRTGPFKKRLVSTALWQPGSGHQG